MKYYVATESSIDLYDTLAEALSGAEALLITMKRHGMTTEDHAVTIGFSEEKEQSS